MTRQSRAFPLHLSSEVLFAGDAPAATLSRRVSRGQLRRLRQGVYTSNLTDPLEDVARRNRWAIAGHFFSGAVISDRSALPGAHASEVVFLVHPGRARDVEMPGLLLRARTGAGPLADDAPLGQHPLHQASLARALVENTQPSRSRGGRPSRTVDRARLEEVITLLRRRDGADRLRRLRAEVANAGLALSLEAGAQQIQAIVDAVLGEDSGYTPTSRMLQAQLKGSPFDPDALSRFDILHDELVRLPPSLRGAAPLSELPFFEAYFSNFIEGTEFAIGDARRIVVDGWDPVDRPQDAHDVRCTFTIVSDLDEMRCVADHSDEFISLLRQRHRVLLASRPDTHPGRFKQQDNRVGATTFVAHELVVGTLREGFARLAALSDPFQRAVFVMFLIAEVHPFDDGNGRIARVFMNAELAAADQQRIVIPPVYRDDYLGALRALSRNSNPAPLGRMLTFAQEFARRVDWSDYDTARDILTDNNALLTPEEAEDTGRRLRLP